ncbi:phosphatidate cytidylyltransferase [Alcaligenaceae bacterium]|nr:phosphatidate cytidylyltransferase [Alcaligenaceae bacterium]
MLKQRLITAVILLAVLLATLLAPSAWPLIALLTVMSACALWEWLRLTTSVNGNLPIVWAVLVGAGLTLLAYQWLQVDPSGWSLDIKNVLMRWLLPLVSLVWLFFATALVVQGQSQQRKAPYLLSAFGILAVIALWVSLVLIYLHHGAWFLVSLMALIWFADTAAYFTGKAFGKHKLAPRVSPGKTWEGAAGGVLAAVIWVAVSSLWSGSFGDVLMQQWSWWLVMLISALLATLSIVGDLFESLLKRRAQVKDSSNLLPGHGGVYDRIDALFPVAPIALLLTGATF